MKQEAWRSVQGDGPLVATAIHDGHHARPEVESLFALDENERQREEDPHTAIWTSVAPTRIVGLRSRFEVDLNRPRDKAVYLRPEDAWGLRVWRQPPSPETVARSLAIYDGFYEEVRRVLDDLTKRFRRIVVLDLHSYNHRRGGPGGEPADSVSHPEINIGTGTMDRRRWACLVDGFMDALGQFDFLGRRLDVRENIKFAGGEFPRWIHQAYPAAVCVISVEVKKFFMDEWSGQVDNEALDAIGRALHSAAACVDRELHAS